jgi:hypothetical protein
MEYHLITATQVSWVANMLGPSDGAVTHKSSKNKLHEFGCVFVRILLTLDG